MINKTNTDCETTLCYYDTATRPRFFHGMLLTDEHLRAEQDYHREALKRVNRHLWGSGIVCGLTVEKDGLCIKVNPGVALDCCGNLIEVCKCITLDLSKECEKKYGSDCPPRQPSVTEKDYEIKKYLVLRYMERETDLEPVLTPDTDCEPAGGKSKCSASKVQEGFCIELWDKCPCPKEIPAGEKGLMAILMRLATNDHQAADMRYPQANQQPVPPLPAPGGAVPDPEEGKFIDLPLCSPCGCCESAVGLAKLTINCSQKTVQVDYDTCRRTIITPRLMSWIFSRIQPQYMSEDMNYVYRKLPDPALANLAVAAVAVEAQGAELEELRKAITQHGQKANTPLKKTGRTARVRNP